MIGSKSILLASVLAVGISAAGVAQAQNPHKGGGAAGRAAPAARAAPAPHFSAPARSAPHFSAPARPQVSRPVFHPPAQAIRPVTPRIQHAAPHIERSGPRVMTLPSTAARQPSSRQAARHERILRRQEERSLRHLSPSERALRRQEFEHARQERLQRFAPTTAQSHGTRVNGQPRITLQAAQQGRFAATFAHHRHTFVNFAPRHAWRRGLLATFVPWYGPVFWPYAYADIFDYTFWPYAYDDGYWAYVYDDVFDGVFWGEAGPPPEYIEGVAYARAPRATYASVQDLCRQPGGGITAWPFAEIENKLGLSEDQRALLGDVRAAADKAQTAFKDSCPSEQAFPLTPPGRLRAMTARLQAVLEAVQTVRPPLTRFYESLSDEQKERFNEIGPKKVAQNGEARAAQDAASCKQPKPGLANLPIEQIEDIVKPMSAQEDSLNRLQDATVKAVTILQDACPDQTPLTPTGRLEMMEARLKAMVEAANVVRPALDDFYGSLSNEQKARFNRMGRALARSD